MTSSENRRVRFPTDRSMGKLSLRRSASRGEWSEYAQALGEINIPSDRDVRLDVSQEAMVDLAPLAALAPADLQELLITSTGKFDDAQLRYISGLRGLVGLSLWETPTGDGAFSGLSRLSNLRWLDIGDTQISDGGLVFLQRCTDLEVLFLLNTNIGNAGLANLEWLKKLKHLDLMGTKVDDGALEILPKLNSLEYLRIVETGISHLAYVELKTALSNCRINYYSERL